MHQLRENGNRGFPVPLASTGIYIYIYIYIYNLEEGPPSGEHDLNELLLQDFT